MQCFLIILNRSIKFTLTNPCQTTNLISTHHKWIALDSCITVCFSTLEILQIQFSQCPEEIRFIQIRLSVNNLTLSHIQKKDYNAAKEDLESLLKVSPRYTRAYLMRGEVSLQQKDTIAALNDFNKALELDKYDPDHNAMLSYNPQSLHQIYSDESLPNHESDNRE